MKTSKEARIFTHALVGHVLIQHPTRDNASGLNFDVMADRPTDSTDYIHSTTLVIIIIYYLPLYIID